VASLADDADLVVAITTASKALMEVAQLFVLSLIGTLIAWLVYTWVPALAAAAPTMGASVAAATAATEVETAVTVGRATVFVVRVISILKRLRTVLMRMHPKTMKRVQVAFQKMDGNKFAKGWIPARDAAEALVKNWRTWGPPLGKVVSGAAAAGGSADHDHDDPGRASDDKLDYELDKDR